MSATRDQLFALGALLLLPACAPDAPDDADTTAPPVTSPADAVDIGNYERLMEMALYTHLGDDRGFGPEHDLARDNIEAEFAAAGHEVVLEPFDYAGSTYANVVATQVGATSPDEVIVVGAHFDSVDNPGADDNATGTALVLELARALSGFTFDRTVRYVAFDREEQGKIGSRAFVHDHDDEVVFALTADMVGQDHGARGHDLFSTFDSLPLVEDFAAAIEEHGNGLRGFPQTGDQYTFSDHDSFERMGIPAFVIIEATYNANPHYHQSTDALDQFDDYIDYDYVEDLLRSCAEFIAVEAR